jgi:predicted amidohydrolase
VSAVLEPGVVLAAAALGPCVGDVSADTQAAVEAVRAAAEAGAEVVLLPELANLPYFAGEVPGTLREKAETVSGALVARFCQLARELAVCIVLPFFEVSPSCDSWHNSAVVISDTGEIVPAVARDGAARSAVRKLHLPVGSLPAPGFDEKAHFTAGEALGVHDVAGLRLGVLICYDRRFPECWRELRALGAQLVLVPMAGDGGDGGEFVVAEMRTHARENGLVVLAASKVGNEIVGQTIVSNLGESMIIGADGRIVAARHHDDGPGLALARIDLQAEMALRAHLRYFDDRRTDIFGGPQPVRTISGALGND